MGRPAVCLLLLAVLAVATLRSSANEQDVVVGIDLGTTYSCVAVYQNDVVQVISNDQGNRITPSIVSFTPEERLIGDAARNQMGNNPVNTIYDVKRLMGKSFKNKSVQDDIKRFPFKVVNKNGKPNLSASYMGESKTWSPEEISAMVLTKMKKVAEEYLGHDVRRAVITVPAYFNDDQRQATKNAGAVAGLTVERIINEPTAASIAYGLDRAGQSQQILVFDFGGGTFDVSLLSISDGVFEVLATNGDTHLGGEDIDNNMEEYFIKRIKEKYGVDVRGRKRFVAKLRLEVERAKRSLSTKTEVNVQLDPVDGIEINERLTRAKFNEINASIFKRTLEPVKRVIADAGVSKKEIDEVVLVGGSTRIPQVQKLLKDFFNGKKLNTEINPDEAVCIGAAAQGHSLAGGQLASLGGADLLLLDVTPLTLGIELQGGVMSPIIERNTVIPMKKSQEYTTTVDHQTEILIKVFQGEGKMTKRNHNLGQFTLDGIPPAPRGSVKVVVTFKIDANGMLMVTAEDKATKRARHISISGNKYKIDEDEIEKMMENAAKYEEEDRLFLEKLKLKNGLDSFLTDIKAQIKGDLGKVMDEADKKKLSKACDETFEWLEQTDNLEKEQLEEKKDEIEGLWYPIVQKYYGSGDKDGEQGGDGGDGDGGDFDGYDAGDGDDYDDNLGGDDHDEL